MTINPLEPVRAAKAGRVTVEMLERLAASLNRSRFVYESRQPYFVNRRDQEGQIVHFLDRQWKFT